MGCLSDEQIEHAARAGPNALAPRPLAHLGRCDACSNRYRQALEDAGVIADLRELRQSRSMTSPGYDETERNR